jgi:hypothetical protein
MRKIEKMTLEEKVDELLKYQRRMHHIVIARTVLGVLTFFVLVVLPILGFYFLADYLSDTVGLSLTEIGETLKRVKSITDIGGVDGLKNLLK